LLVFLGNKTDKQNGKTTGAPIHIAPASAFLSMFSGLEVMGIDDD